MSRYRALFIGFPIVSALLGLSTPAAAHHESWILKNPGTQCTFETPATNGLDNYFATALYNGSASARWMSCPVALSARWGSSTPNYPVARWARAYSADVYVLNNDPGQNFSCMARAYMSSSAMRFSKTVFTSAGGYQRLRPAVYANGVSDWGGDLETVEGETIRALDFRCSVPGNWSGVLGNKVRLCIRNSSCGDPNDPDTQFTTTAGGSESIQTSGIECTAYMNNDIQRGHFGVKNASTTNYGSVQCPIVPSADDTNEVRSRSVSALAYFDGLSLSGPFPACQIAWRNRVGGVPVGDEFFSNAFFPPSIGDNKMLSPQGINVGQDVAMALFCDLPPGVTLKGLTTTMSVAPVSGGF